MRFLKNNFILIIILAASFVVRVIGINYNLPFSTVVGDEIVITAGSLKMLGEQALTPPFQRSNYFPLSYYLYIPFLLLYILYLKFFSPFGALEAIKELGILRMGNFLIAGRFISVLLGVASVLLIYLISRRLFQNKRTSLIASALFCISPLNVLMSH